MRLILRSRRTPGQAGRWRERVGFYTGRAPATHPIWIHAVSVGETMAAVPLVRALHEQFDGIAILLTTTTATGAQISG